MPPFSSKTFFPVFPPSLSISYMPQLQSFAHRLFLCKTMFQEMPIAFLPWVSFQLSDTKTSPCIHPSGSLQTG